jgi:serine kinase of HPr protein (carbohydrate metabolism regulator)
VILHAGLVALRLGGQWRGALIEGPSGAGKSDLALRTLEAGFRLVADDRTLVWRSGDAAYGRAPDALHGLIEARGQGILSESALALAQIVLVARCVSDSSRIDRMPDLDMQSVAGQSVPRLAIDPFEASAPAKLRRAMEHLGAAGQQAYLAASLCGRGRAGTGDTH